MTAPESRPPDGVRVPSWALGALVALGIATAGGTVGIAVRSGAAIERLDTVVTRLDRMDSASARAEETRANVAVMARTIDEYRERTRIAEQKFDALEQRMRELERVCLPRR
jgi:DNA repair ATPase RecN